MAPYTHTSDASSPTTTAGGAVGPAGAAPELALVPLSELSGMQLAKLVSLEERAQRSAPHYDDAPWTLENVTRVLPGKDELSLAATVAGDPIGFLVASRRPDGVHVHRVAVDTDGWGDGIASALLAQVLSRASGTVTLVCDPRNTPAINLYRRAGFRITGTTRTGKLTLSTATLPSTDDLCLRYVFTAAGMQTGHAAHVPGLINTMSRLSRTRAVRYGHDAELPSFRRPLRWASAFVRLVRQSRRDRVDVMVVRIHWKLAALLSLAGRGRGGWLVALWSSGGQGFLPGTRQSLLRRLGRVAHRFVLRHAVDAVITGPPRLLDEYADRYGLPRERLLLGCNDVDGNAWRAAADRQPELASDPVVRRWLDSPYRLLYAHGLDPIRGADRLPYLIAGIRNELGDAELLVLGDGPLRGRLDSAGLLVAGKVRNEVAAWAMSRAHCLLVPSRQEGFPRVIVEAMALGLPCACFDVGGCADIFGRLRHSYVAPDGDLDRFISLAARAARCRAHTGPQPDLVDRAEAFNTERVAATLIATLRSLRAQGRGTASWLSRSLWRSVFPRRRW